MSTTEQTNQETLRKALEQICADYDQYEAVTARWLYMIAYRALRDAGLLQGPPSDPK